MPKPLPPSPEDLAALLGGDGETFDYRKSSVPVANSNGIQTPTATPEILLGGQATRHINADPVDLYAGDYVDSRKMAMPAMQLSGRHIEADPIELSGGVDNGGGSGVARVANRGMPGGGDASKYPEPPPGPQAIQGIPPMLARPPASAAGRAGPKAPRAAAAATAAPGPTDAVSSGAQETPDFLAYVRQRAQDKMDLAQAQGKADDARRWQDVANGFVRAGDVASGRKTDEGALQQRLENTQQPVRNVLQQQEAGRQSTNEALAQTQLSGKMWEQRMATQAADPNSPISKRTQGFLASTGLFKPGAEKFVSAADYGKALEAGTAGIHALALKAQIAHQNAQLALEKGKADEDIRNHDMQHEAAMFGKMREVPPREAGQLESLMGAAQGLSDLKGERDKTGAWAFVDKLQSYMGMGDYAAMKNAVAPELAKGDKGGSVTPANVVREKQILPGPFDGGGDTFFGERSRNVIQRGDAMLRTLKHSRKMDPAQIADLESQWEEKKASLGGMANAPVPGGQAKSGNGMVDVIDANGNPGQIPAVNLKAALDRGAKLAR